MESLLKILEWFSRSTLSTILLVISTIGLLAGIAFLAVGSIRKFWWFDLQEPQSKTTLKTGKWILIPSFALLLVVAVAQTSASYLLGFQQLPLHTFLDYLQVALIIFALIFTLYLVRQVRHRIREIRAVPLALQKEIRDELKSVIDHANAQLEEETQKLIKAQESLVAHIDTATNQLVDSVEDATRHVLIGFPRIFDRAFQLIAEADRELWVISFVFNFGHCHVDAVSSAYSQLPVTDRYKKAAGETTRRDLKSDVGKFKSLLINKVGVIPEVHLLTICDTSVRTNFLEPLFERPRYAKPFTNESKTVDADARTKQLALEFQEISGSKVLVLNRLRYGRTTEEWSDMRHSACMYEATSLPIQVLIAGKQGQEKTGCLVFMVGTEILRAAKVDTDASGDADVERFDEPGFYTELPEVVDVYKSLAHALLKQAKSDFNDATRDERELQNWRDPYDGD